MRLGALAPSLSMRCVSKCNAWRDFFGLSLDIGQDKLSKLALLVVASLPCVTLKKSKLALLVVANFQ
jgi:hypothetical protein